MEPKKNIPSQKLPGGKVLPIKAGKNTAKKSDNWLTDKGSENEEDKEKSKTQTDQLLSYKQYMELFHDEHKVGYARYKIGDHYEVWPIESMEFKSRLTSLYLKHVNRAPNKNSLEEAIRTYSALAIHQGKCKPVFQRVAYQDGHIFIDLCNDEWKVIKIGLDGWNIENKPPVAFIRSAGMRSLPLPERGGSINELRKFLNVSTDRDFRLAVGWLMATFRPGYPFPVLILQGEQGSSKSTTTKVLRSFIDPSAVSLTNLPGSERDIFIQASNCWVMAFDNLSGLTNKLSDCLCRISTGGGFLTRKLYTDLDQTIIEAKRPIILNGIDDIATRDDLMDRSIVLELPVITGRKSEQEFWSEFEQAMPRIFGAILDAISSVLSKIDSINLEADIRMLDFARWVTAAEEALGWPEGQLVRDYQANKSDAIRVVLNDDPLAQAVIQLAERYGRWVGSAAEFREAVRSPDIFKPLDIPRSQSHIGRGLNRLKSSMRKYGILLERKRESSNNYWVIQKLDSTEPSTPSRDGSNGN